MAFRGSISTSTPTAKPFLKWAGGKAQLLPEIQAAIAKGLVGDRVQTYVEPFLGGGAVFFHTTRQFTSLKRTILNDINPEPIAAYRAIKNRPEDVIEALTALEQEYLDRGNLAAKKTFFLAKRKEFNRLKLNQNKAGKERDFLIAVLLIFLNKTCFNGLYRVNSKGGFNVPFGQRERPKICDRANLLRVSECLQETTIECGDFEVTEKYAGSNTFYYLDPPYKPLNATSSFTAYAKEDFGDRDQSRLKEFCDRLNATGAYFLLSNSDPGSRSGESFFDRLYENYHIKRVQAKRNINCKGNGRGAISELLIANFPLN